MTETQKAIAEAIEASRSREPDGATPLDGALAAGRIAGIVVRRTGAGPFRAEAVYPRGEGRRTVAADGLTFAAAIESLGDAVGRASG